MKVISNFFLLINECTTINIVNLQGSFCWYWKRYSMVWLPKWSCASWNQSSQWGTFCLYNDFWGLSATFVLYNFTITGDVQPPTSGNICQWFGRYLLCSIIDTYFAIVIILLPSTTSTSCTAMDSWTCSHICGVSCRQKSLFQNSLINAGSGLYCKKLIMILNFKPLCG